MGRRATIYTLGCRLNQAESGLLAERLAAAGYELVPFGEPADLGVIHTCTVTGEADAKSRKVVRGFIRANPKAFIAVVGCYAELAYASLARIEGIDLIVGNREKLNLLDYVKEGKNAAPVVVRPPLPMDDFEIEVCGSAPLPRRVNLKIQDGCNSFCSYCLVPHARGRSRSRALDNLLDEARRLAARGVKEIVLSGVNTGQYAYEGKTLADVIDCLDDIEGIQRIRLGSIEMSTISGRLLERMNDPGCALVPFLHVPLQSGADAVLERMNRPYSGAAFLAFAERACRTVDGLGLGTDVLVGFPGETDEDFEATCRIVANSPLAYAHVFKYSARPGTPAASMPGQVPPQVMNERSARIRALSDRKRDAFHERHAGKTLDVLFEDAHGGYWQGYTGNYIRVAVRFEGNLANCIRAVRLDEARGENMGGRICDE